MAWRPSFGLVSRILRGLLAFLEAVKKPPTKE